MNPSKRPRLSRPQTARAVARRAASIEEFGMNLRDWFHELRHLSTRAQLLAAVKVRPERLAGRFPLGDVAALSTSLVRLADRVEHHEGPTERLERMQEAARRFDWDDSARQTREVYLRATMRGSRLAASAP